MESTQPRGPVSPGAQSSAQVHLERLLGRHGLQCRCGAQEGKLPPGAPPGIVTELVEKWSQDDMKRLVLSMREVDVGCFRWEL